MPANAPQPLWQEALQALEAALNHQDEERAEAAARQLTQGPPEEVVPHLLPWLSHPDPDRRWWALRVLAFLPHPQVPRALRDALRDPDPAVCHAAALALRHQPAPEALEDLLDLLGSPDRLLAELASDALVALGKRATEGLMRVIREGPMQARAQAVRALARVRDVRAIPLLVELLDDPSPLITQWAEEGLEALGVGTVFFWP